MLIAFNNEVLLGQKIVDKIIPSKQNTNEIKEIVYCPFRNSGK
jgi:hypothetical protein